MVGAMKKVVLIAAVVAIFVFQFSVTSCTTDGYADENDAVLAFSADTVSFDTVFTTMASTVRVVCVYNLTGQDVLLSSITLEGGRSSRFRLNVDGDTSMVARNVEIMAGDSIFIFVTANINPNDQTSPFVVEDAIRFSNGQRLPLSAWGRNAVYHKALPGHWVHVIDCDNWDHTRPHIFLDTAAVDSACTLQLNAGEELYFADRATLLVYRDGTLRANGTAEQPVLFTSLRHDGWYDFLPGQWAGLWFSALSKDNVMDHCVVEKGTFGIVVDTNQGPNPTLTISNTVVRHMSYTGILGQGARIVGNNLLVYQCGTATLWLRAGGDYSFTGCTFAGYWRYGGRQNPTVVLQNFYLAMSDVIIPRELTRADFTDCIIWGTWPDTELLQQQAEETTFNSRFIHSLVKGGDWSEDPLFENADENDYHLQEGSPAYGIGFQYDDI